MMNVKRLIFITGVILITCVIISSAFEAGNNIRQTVYHAQEVSETEKTFVMSSEHGRLVVYRKGEQEPFMTTDTFTYSLPKTDKRQLEQGIEIQGEEELRKTLEDYCS